MKAPDVDKIRSESKMTLQKFLTAYNLNLPTDFPKATAKLLREFQKVNVGLFKGGADVWTLDVHRKKLMDWLPQRQNSRD